jgi:hypothetical protein
VWVRLALRPARVRLALRPARVHLGRVLGRPRATGRRQKSLHPRQRSRNTTHLQVTNEVGDTLPGQV